MDRFFLEARNSKAQDGIRTFYPVYDRTFSLYEPVFYCRDIKYAENIIKLLNAGDELDDTHASAFVD